MKEKVEEILSNIFKITGEDISYEFYQEGNQLNLVISGENVAHLIGYKGKTIEAFQSLINSMLQREDEEYAKVFVEINDYKKKKEEKLRRPIKLEPMSAYERLIIHRELADRKDVETESIGEEPRRRVVIKRKYNYR